MNAMSKITAEKAITLVKPNASDRLIRAARAFDRADSKRAKAEALVWVEHELIFELGLTPNTKASIVDALKPITTKKDHQSCST